MPQMEQIRRQLLEDALEFHRGFLAEKSDEPAVIASAAEGHRRLGLLNRMLDRKVDAEKAYRGAIELYQGLVRDRPDACKYRLGLARTHRELGFLLERISEDGSAPWRPTLGILMDKLGRNKDAEEAYRTAIELCESLVRDSPEVDECRSGLANAQASLGGLLARLGRNEDAKKAFREAVALSAPLVRDHPGATGYRNTGALAHNGLGRALAKLGQWEQAERALREAVALSEPLVRDHPDVASYRHALAVASSSFGVLLAKRGRKLSAERAYFRAIEVSVPLLRDHPDIHEYRYAPLRAQGGLSALLRGLDWDRRAERAFRRAIELGEQVTNACPEVVAPRVWLAGMRNGLAWRLATCADQTRRNPADAVALAQEAVGSTSVPKHYLNTLGVAHYRTGNWAEALKALQKSAQLQGDNSFDFFFLAMSHWRLGNRDDARQWYDKAVAWMEKNKPNDEELKRFRAEAEELLGIATK